MGPWACASIPVAEESAKAKSAPSALERAEAQSATKASPHSTLTWGHYQPPSWPDDRNPGLAPWRDANVAHASPA